MKQISKTIEYSIDAFIFIFLRLSLVINTICQRINITMHLNYLSLITI